MALPFFRQRHFFHWPAEDKSGRLKALFLTEQGFFSNRFCLSAHTLIHFPTVFAFHLPG